MITTVIFDFGNTLIRQQIDDEHTLDELILEPVEGASELIERLGGGYQIGLLSNTRTSREEHVRRAATRLGWGTAFDCIVTSTDAGVEKPAPEIFHAILARMGEVPRNALMVGNDLEADVRGAHEAGLLTAFFSCNPADWSALDASDPRPDFVLQQLTDLESVLNSLTSSSREQAPR